jgi:hypothetical protein
LGSALREWQGAQRSGRWAATKTKTRLAYSRVLLHYLFIVTASIPNRLRRQTFIAMSFARFYFYFYFSYSGPKAVEKR